MIMPINSRKKVKNCSKFIQFCFSFYMFSTTLQYKALNGILKPINSHRFLIICLSSQTIHQDRSRNALDIPRKIGNKTDLLQTLPLFN